MARPGERTCIYCPKPPDAREHWLPRGLGNIRGGALLLNRVCESCNRELGRELDEPFLRTGPTGILRTILGVSGRSKHRRVSPFDYKAGAPTPPNRMVLPDTSDGVRLDGEIEPGTGRSSVRRQIVVRKAGKLYPVPFPTTATGMWLRESLAAKGLGDAELVRVYCGKGEGPDSEVLRALLSEVFGQFSVPAYSWDGTEVGQMVTAELWSGISAEYIRAVAKVAFHYTLWAVPGVSGQEPRYRALKDFIRWGAGEWRRFVLLEAPQFVEPLKRGLAPENPYHFLATQVNDSGHFTAVQFFVHAKHVMPPAMVRLAVAVPLGIPMTAHGVRYFASLEDGYAGEIIEATIG